MIGMFISSALRQKMEGCSFEVIVGRVCGCNPKDRKRNSEIVPLVSCNWALVVPPRANSSRSGPISPLSFVSGCPYSALCCYGGIAQNASGKNLRHFVSERRSGDLKDMFVFYLESYTINGISTTISKEREIADRFRGGGRGVRICRVKKKPVGARGEYEHEQDRGNGTIMLQKTI